MPRTQSQQERGAGNVGKAKGGSENAAIGSRPAAQRDASYGSKPGEGIGKKAKEAGERVKAELAKEPEIGVGGWLGRALGALALGVPSGGALIGPGWKGGGWLGGLFDNTPQDNAQDAYNDVMGAQGADFGGGWSMGGTPGRAPGGQGSGGDTRHDAFMQGLKTPIPDPLTGTIPPPAPAPAPAGPPTGQPGTMLPGDWNRYGETQPEYQFYPPMSQIMMDLAKEIIGKKKAAPAGITTLGAR